MKEVLFSVPIKSGCLDQYKQFAEQTVQRAKEYADMLQRYDIKTAKVWCTTINNKDFVLVHHYVGPTFNEKMKQWDTSPHPFDCWFRENMAAVYDTNRPGDMEQPEQVVDFDVAAFTDKQPDQTR